MDENLKNSENNNGVEIDIQNVEETPLETITAPDDVAPTELVVAPDVVGMPEATATPVAVTTPDVVPGVEPAVTSTTVAVPSPELYPESQVPISAESNIPVVPSKKRLSKRTKIIIAIVVAVIVLAAGATAYFVNRHLDQSSNAVSQTAKDVDTTDNKASTPVDTVETVAEESQKVTYHIASWNYQTSSIDTRIKLSAKITKYEYHTIAKLDGGSTLTKLSTGPSNSNEAINENVYFIVSSSKVLVANNLSQSALDISAYGVEKVDVIIPEFNPTTPITYSSQTFTTSDTWGNDEGIAGYGTDYTVTLLTTTTLGKFYQITKVVSGADGYMLRAYDLVTPDARTHRYKLDTAKISNDDGTLKVNWNDSSNKTVTFVNPLHGCGQGYSDSDTILSSTPDLSTAIKVGTTTASGKQVYRLTTASFVKAMYDEYATGRTTDKIPLADFQTKLTHVVFQDGFGKWILLQNSNYGPNAECGKPVVYLYPTKTTSVNVAVGADITKSIPTYPIGGWKNVIAQPSGSLSYGGHTYESLFWEGKGHGSYPDTSLVGTVAPQSKLLGTVRQQLAAQGLNTKETNDFMDFWSSKLPKTSYVKLTWLTTSQMNELAPLNISPKPNTVIRVFLDARGLDKPVSLTPQALSTSSRQGFTVVEWGGLMSASSH